MAAESQHSPAVDRESFVCGGYELPVGPTAPSKPVCAPLTNDVGGSRHSLENGEESALSLMMILDLPVGLFDPVLSDLVALKRRGSKEE